MFRISDRKIKFLNGPKTLETQFWIQVRFQEWFWSYKHFLSKKMFKLKYTSENSRWYRSLELRCICRQLTPSLENLKTLINSNSFLQLFSNSFGESKKILYWGFNLFYKRIAFQFFIKLRWSWLSFDIRKLINQSIYSWKHHELCFPSLRDSA